MAQLPAKQDQYVKYAEKDKNGKELIGLADVIYMNEDRTEMTIDGNLAVNGEITGDSIIENMSGYSFLAGSKAGMDLNIIYASAVKNGNKLTIVLFASFTRDGSIENGYATLGVFGVPSAVADKLYSYTIGDSSSALDYRQNSFYKKSDASGVSISTYIEKVNSNNLEVVCTGLNTLEAATEYVVRIENTFLLSENLVQ